MDHLSVHAAAKHARVIPKGETVRFSVEVVRPFIDTSGDSRKFLCYFHYMTKGESSLGASSVYVNINT